MDPPSETTVPLLPCTSLDTTLDFYQTLGFVVTYQQREPYLYAAVQRGAISLHFASLRVYSGKMAFGAYLAFVPAVAPYHRAFADALRARYGAVPTAGIPRITRFTPGQTRFKLFDPSGNLVIFIDRDEPDGSYSWSEESLSMLEQAREQAVFLRDTYANDEAAAKVLDKALAAHPSAAPVERARALAARAELAVAIGDSSRADAARAELAQIALTDAERATHHSELRAADALERWRVQRDD